MGGRRNCSVGPSVMGVQFSCASGSGLRPDAAGHGTGQYGCSNTFASCMPGITRTAELEAYQAERMCRYQLIKGTALLRTGNSPSFLPPSPGWRTPLVSTCLLPNFSPPHWGGWGEGTWPRQRQRCNERRDLARPNACGPFCDGPLATRTAKPAVGATWMVDGG